MQRDMGRMRLLLLPPMILAVACGTRAPSSVSAERSHSINAPHADSETIGLDLKVDVCVYGASAAGVFAAVAAAREGHTVAIVEPTHRIGGVLASGFRVALDVPEPHHLGGLARNFYEKDVALHQGGFEVGTLRHYQGAGKDNSALLQSFVRAQGDLITLIVNNRVASVASENGRIAYALFEHAVADRNGVPPPKRSSDKLTKVSAKAFIDASYEGDLMALSGVSYRVGREGRDEYGESLAGVLIGKRPHDMHVDVSLDGEIQRHEFPGVDPYVIKGNPKSGLLSPISAEPIGKEGESSRFFMGWNFKLAWETGTRREHPGIVVGPPSNKSEGVYELLRRYVEAGYPISWPFPNWHRGELMTGAIAGAQTDYPDGDWQTRSRIWQQHVDHVRTLTDFTGRELRLLSDQNEAGGWPFLYMRAGRRMVGEYVITQHDVQLQTDVPDPIGMGYYAIDIYPARLAVRDDGVLVHEGEVFSLASPGPYQIPYGAIIPRRGESRNLLVPMMMSATHVAYASIRMEATYMVMGEAAGIAAALSVKSNKAVQDIDRAKLMSILRKRGQNLSWDGKGFYTTGRWRFSVFDEPLEITPRWETNPEEYSKYPVTKLWGIE